MEHPLTALRSALGLSQERFARELNMSTRTIQTIEARTHAGWPSNAIRALSAHFGITLDQAQALCDGTILEADLRDLIAMATAKSGGNGHEHVQKAAEDARSNNLTSTSSS